MTKKSITLTQPSCGGTTSDYYERMAEIWNFFIINLNIKFSSSSSNSTVFQNFIISTIFIIQWAIKAWMVENIIIAVMHIYKIIFFKIWTPAASP